MVERAVAAAEDRARWRSRAGRSHGRGRRRSSTSRPWARPAAIAEASVQPVPWVWRVAIRGLSQTLSTGGGHQHVRHGFPGEMPALDQHRPAAEREQASPAARISATLPIVAPHKISASGRFGVTISARAISSCFSASTAAGIDQPGAPLGDHHRIDDKRYRRGALAAAPRRSFRSPPHRAACRS